jgi:hypothetical protein
VRAGKRGGSGKEAGEVPYPKAELWRQLVATEERRGGGSDDDRGATANVAVRPGFTRQEVAAAGFVDPRARGGGFIGRPRLPWACRPVASRGGGGCATAGLSAS